MQRSFPLLPADSMAGIFASRPPNRLATRDCKNQRRLCSMREIVLDTETTGFDAVNGDRLVEVGCIELMNHVATGKTFWKYLNPERDVPMAAFQVHGLSAEFLSDKPKFAEVADQLLEFVGDSPVIAHNAEFDMKFINAELERAGKPTIAFERAIDTVAM